MIEEERTAVRFLYHFKVLIKEFFKFAWQNKAWWIIPMLIVLLLIAVLVFVGQGSVPFLYTLF